jgi:hypothetical protein
MLFIAVRVAYRPHFSQRFVEVANRNALEGIPEGTEIIYATAVTVTVSDRWIEWRGTAELLPLFKGPTGRSLRFLAGPLRGTSIKIAITYNSAKRFLCNSYEV